RITIKGNGAEVTHNATATYQGIIMMKATSNVTIDSLVFKSLSTTYGFGAILYDGCAFDSIKNCTFDLSSITSTATANSSGIKISSTPNSQSITAHGATRSYIGKNHFIGNSAT